jgi:uncharacterized protein
MCAMGKQHFFVKLVPPRATFPQDITNEEKALMREHGRYTREFFEAGKVLCYGPVMAGGGAFGAAIVEFDNETEARQFVDSDPTVKARLNKYELWPMQLAGARGTVEVA